MKLIMMAKKFKRVWKDEGIATAIERAVHFAGNIEDRRNRRNDIKRAKNTKGNVLYINGCCVEHPIRYRVMHQMEELRLAGAVCEKVFVEDIDPAMEENFDTFIFFRCECSEKVERFIHKAKKDGKKVYFDIDDLVIDTKYTDRIPFVQEMTSLNRRVFDAGVIRTGKTLGLCDAAITTTETLAEELGKVVPAVYINRNAASKRMVECAQDAMEQKKQNSDNMIWLGYFSGSLTHNRDFEMIRPALAKILQTHQNVGLLLAGDLNVSDTLNQYGKRIIKKRTTGWQDLPKLLIQADINLAPLEDTLFNCAKSEIKWIEAALVRVPTVASKVGAFEKMVEDGMTGILCENTEDSWYEALMQLVCDATKRKKIGENAYRYVMEHCTTEAVARNYMQLVVEMNKTGER